ncbi:MAG: alpha/beta fold hydrolase [Gemmatales bacterium]|nr:alpha/beta fold hydrolase [Gemmatales bacterium]MDW7993016.1 alpha/beta fold hydrolase [Gemmatales bacterium]
MDWLGSLLTWIICFALTCAGLFGLFLAWIFYRYVGIIVRIFQERPIFIVPHGEPVADAEDVSFPTTDGLHLMGSYLHTPRPRRKGVILFGTEYGSNRWSCLQYCRQLLDEGFDIFTFEFRNCGESDCMPGYKMLQWVTNYEVEDVLAAVRYLKSRPDADDRGIGFFGVSRGGSAGILAAAREPYIRCVVTDGAFDTIGTMVPYMQRWISLYSLVPNLYRILPRWVYILAARMALWKLSQQYGCEYPSVGRAISKLAPRPLLMIHGGADNYIRPEWARELFARAREPKELWIVEKAKHNQAVQVAGEEYQERICQFFQKHLTSSRKTRWESQEAIKRL